MKKFISIGLSILLALSCLTGCGGGSDNAGGSNNAGGNASNEGNADAGNSGAAVFKIGGIGPLTGGAAADRKSVV